MWFLFLSKWYEETSKLSILLTKQADTETFEVLSPAIAVEKGSFSFYNSNKSRSKSQQIIPKMNTTITSLFHILIVLASTESYIVTIQMQNFANTRNKLFTTTSLLAYSPSPGGSTHNMHSSSGWGCRSTSASVPSKTACESAVNVEWEPMSELDRRIEDGIHYEHIPNRYESEYEHEERRRMPGCHSKAKRIDDNDEDNSSRVRAVFCAYRYTAEDYNRMKSANIS